MKKDKYLIIGILAVAVVGFFVATRWYKGSEKKRLEQITAGKKEPLVRPHSPRLGPDTASVTIVEFFDPECESCRAFYPAAKQVLKEFDGKVQLVLRYMTFHKNSGYAVGILEGARRQGKYWEALELLFARQPEWASHHAPKPELLVVYMKELGLDIEQLKASAEDSEVKSRILQDKDDGMLLGVRGTPTFFVNGKLLPRLGYQELRSAIQEALD